MPLFGQIESNQDASQNSQLLSLSQRLTELEAELIRIDGQLGAIPPPPTLESLGAEPVGAEARAKAYVDQRFPIVPTPTTEIRVNCGGSSAYTDVTGKIWGVDQYFEFGNADASYSGLVAATYDSFLFNRSRSGGTTFSYKIPVPNGNYKVELGFSENWHTTVNSRKFHVDIEGIRVLTDFDIRAQSGMRYSAIKRLFDATVNDGLLNIVFIPVVDGAQINNIYVYSV